MVQGIKNLLFLGFDGFVDVFRRVSTSVAKVLKLFFLVIFTFCKHFNPGKVPEHNNTICRILVNNYVWAIVLRHGKTLDKRAKPGPSFQL